MPRRPYQNRYVCTFAFYVSNFFWSHVFTRQLLAAGVSLEGFLSSLGRSAETKVKVDDWESFWKMDRHTFRKAGLPVRDRRYILWCMEKYRQGLDPKEFAHEAPPKKKIRGYESCSPWLVVTSPDLITDMAQQCKTGSASVPVESNELRACTLGTYNHN